MDSADKVLCQGGISTKDDPPPVGVQSSPRRGGGGVVIRPARTVPTQAQHRTAQTHSGRAVCKTNKLMAEIEK